MSLRVGRYGYAEPVPLEGGERHWLARWVTTSTLWHPQYRQHLLVLITLADVDPLASPPPVVDVPGATHAVASATVDPAHQYEEHLPVRWMEPMNFEVQFVCGSDERAVRLMSECVDAVVDGGLNPESGNAPLFNQRQWQQFIEGALR